MLQFQNVEIVHPDIGAYSYELYTCCL